MEALDMSMPEADFVLNDGEVTMVADMTIVSRLGKQQDEDCEARLHQDAKHDGSDSGVELNGAEGAADGAGSGGAGASPDRDCGERPSHGPSPPALQDYDATSEGGSESSSVLSHTPARKKSSSSSSSTSCSTPGSGHPRQGHPRSRSVAAAGCASPGSPASPSGVPAPSPRPRERSAAGRGSSCSRGRQGSSDAGVVLQTAARASSRSQRAASAASAASGCLMTSSLTGSMTASLTLGSSHGSSSAGSGGGSAAGGNVRGRGTTRAPTSSSTARASSRGGATTMATSTDDGRWPSTVQRPTTLSRARASSVAPHGDRKLTLTSSSSKTSVNSTNSASTPSPTVESKCEKFCTLPRRRRRRSVESIGGERVASASTASSSRKVKVTLYHETGAQTALTVSDLDDLLEGKACRLRPVDAQEQCDQAVQVDRDRDDVVAHMLERRLKAVVDALGFEHSGAPRPAARSPAGGITSTVPSPGGPGPSKGADPTAWVRTLELLEQRAASVKKRDLLQRNEIGRLRYQVEQTERLRKRLQSQQEETEAETLEMQEFLQVEKTMLAESLKEAESEIQAKLRIVESLNEELERQREECQHLVRISEQRRQENLTLQARVAALEQRSKESLLQQGAAVSGASVALSALSSRLDELAVQLEKSSMEKALSTITLEAEAVTTRTKEACRPLSMHLENHFQTLDNVTEPDLEEEGGGQRDITINDTTEPSRLFNSESIQNLSAAIIRRLQEEAVSSETNVTDDVPGHLVDQVLDVDSLVTRVLRAISNSVNNKKMLVTDESSMIFNGAKHEMIESVVNQKVEGHTETSKPTHIPLLNGSNEGSCSDGKSLAVAGRVDMSLSPEPVTGAA